MYKNYKQSGYKQLIVLKRPEEVNCKMFSEWFLEHASKVKKIDGLKFYAIYPVYDPSKIGPPYYGPSPSYWEPTPFDAFEVMWFDTFKSLKKAYESDIWQQQLKEMENLNLYRLENFQGVWGQLFTVGMKGLDKVLTKKGTFVHLGILKNPSFRKYNRKAIKDFGYEHATNIIDKDGYNTVPEIFFYTHAYSLIDSPYGAPFVDLMSMMWYESLEELKKSFVSDTMEKQEVHGEIVFDFHDTSITRVAWSEQLMMLI